MLNLLVAVAGILLGAGRPTAYADTATYNIHFMIGDSTTVTGTITTNGARGALTRADLLSYALKFSDRQRSYYYSGNSIREPVMRCGTAGCGMSATSNSLVASLGSITFGKPAACCDHMRFQYHPLSPYPYFKYGVSAANYTQYGNREDPRNTKKESTRVPFVLGMIR